MKKAIKLIGIIALAVVIGFSFAACYVVNDNGGDDGGGGGGGGGGGDGGSLSNGVWTTNYFYSSDYEHWYTFYASYGQTYYIWCDDADSYSAYIDAKISAYYGSAYGTSIFTGSDSTYYYPESFTANRDGYVYIRVYPYSSGDDGYYRIAYRTYNSRPN